MFLEAGCGALRSVRWGFVSPYHLSPSRLPLPFVQPERTSHPQRDEIVRAEENREPVASTEDVTPARPTGRAAARLAGPVARARTAPVSADVRLLAIATEHLARLGPKRVTVVAVAAEAGMTH